MQNKFSFKFIALVLIVLSLQACGGGGSSGGGGGGSEGVRVIHGAIDAPPLSFSVSAQEIDSVSYNEESFYQGVSSGRHVFSAYRPDFPGEILATTQAVVEEGKAYSLLVGGSLRSSNLSLNLVEDDSSELEEGQARVNIYNLYEGTGSLSATIDGQGTGAVSGFRGSEFLIILPGEKQLVVASSGASIKAVRFTAEAGKSHSVMISGSDELGVIFSRLYTK